MSALPGRQLERLAATAASSLMLVAPFTKESVVERLLSHVREGVDVCIYTRWRVDEVAAGVSDLAVWNVAQNHGASVWLCNSLHGKLYLSDARALVGSANLTNRALGWAPSPNLELLIECPPTDAGVVDFVAELQRHSVPASQQLHDDIAALVEGYREAHPTPEPASSVAAAGMGDDGSPSMDWFPQLQEPRDFVEAYQGNLECLTRQGCASARIDLEALSLPAGLDDDSLRAVVAGALLQTPLLASIDSLVAEPQRFGAVVDLIASETGMPREQATYVWQGLMRWMLFFLPDRYVRWVDRHTEMFRRTEY